jgi:hypothetical protein
MLSPVSLRDWANEVTEGLAGDWYCLMFDECVRTLGVWVENKLSERHPKTHERMYTLEDLIGKPKGVKEALKSKHFRPPPTLSKVVR